MLNWDTLMMASQAMTLLAALPTVFNVQAYIPRWTSALMVVGLSGVTAALLGLGAPLGALITSLVVCAFIFIGLYRGRLRDQDDLWTEAEAKDEVAEMLEAAAIRVAEAEAEARGESDG